MVLVVLGWLGWKWMQVRAVVGTYEGWLESIHASHFSEEDKAALLSQMERMRVGIEAGDVLYSEILEDELRVNLLITVSVIQNFSLRVLEPLDMDMDEKERAQRTMQRLARGIWEHEISPGASQDLLADPEPLSPGLSLDRWQSPDEVRATVAAVKERVDSQGIPDEGFRVDVPAEFGSFMDTLVDAE